MQLKKAVKVISVLLVLILGFSGIVYANSALILVDELHVREGPGKTYDPVGRVHSDEQYTVVEQQKDWVKIQFEDQSGWVSEEFISINENTDPAISSIAIRTDGTQIRSGPSIDEEISSFADKGAHFNVISKVGNWYEIKNNDQKGYIHQNIVMEDDPDEHGTLRNQVYVIDPGHGGHDTGAIGVHGHYEKDIAYKTAKTLESTLTNLGAEVHLTRSNDEFIRLGSRVSSSNYLSPDAFISIHYNSFPESPSVSGVGTYYYHDDDEMLAENVQEQIIQSTNANDRGSIHEDYQVLRHNRNPALLLELGFISNEDEAQLLWTDSYQEKLVQGIVNGLLHDQLEK